MSKDNQKTPSITPLADRVLLKPIQPEDLEKKSTSGIIIPDTVSKEKPEQGIVIAVGKGKYDDGVLVPLTVKVGDTVVFAKYGYEEIKIDATEYYIISESNILAVIK
ncbi:MAG: co-chaperone GroES [Candidatus Paceibacterota bacterium]|jgi:chaperonin GroES